MRMPKLTLLQWFVFSQLLDGEQPTESLRSAVRKVRVAASVPAFQQLLARMEAAGYLHGRYVRSCTEGKPVRLRLYRLTPAGRRAWKELSVFVVQHGHTFAKAPTTGKGHVRQDSGRDK